MLKLTNSPAENKMGVMPVNRLLVSMSLPMVISMLVQALYNVVDTIFVSSLGQDALTALSLSFSLQNLMIAVSTGTGVGVNALLSRSLGAKKFDRANKAATNGIFLSLCSALAFMLVGFFLIRPFFEMFGSSAGVVEYGTQYLSICCIFSFGIFGQVIFERLLQATGKTIYSMVTQLTGAIINIILDPILIYGYFGMPALGVAGAAVATVAGQIVACLFGIYFNFRFNKEIKLEFKGFRPDGEIIGRIYSVGLPSIAMGSVGSLMNAGINQIVRICGDVAETAQAVFGLYFKIQSFIFMPVFGLNNGMVPIVAYNFGAKKRDRMTKTIKLSVIYACAMMFIGFLVFQIFPEQLIGIFADGADVDKLLTIGVPAFRTISISFLFAGFCIVILSVFQALGHGMLSLITSLARQLGALLPVALSLALITRSVNAIWFAFPVAEIISVTLSALFFVRVYKAQIKNL